MPFPPPDPDGDDGPERSHVSTHLTTPSPRPGDLTGAWRVMLGAAWLTAFFAYAAMWQASVQIGIGTWWVGPRAQPTHVAVKLIPFVLTVVMGLLIIYNARWIVRWSAAGVAGAVLISLPDFSRSIGLGVAEAVIATLLGVITLASLTGRFRTENVATGVPAPAPAAAPPEPAPH